MKTVEEYLALPVFNPQPLNDNGINELFSLVSVHCDQRSIFREFLESVHQILVQLGGPSGKENPRFNLRFLKDKWPTKKGDYLVVCFMQFTVGDVGHSGIALFLDKGEKIIVKCKQLSALEIEQHTRAESKH